MKVSLKPQKGMWAPGDYFGKCDECKKEYIGDKRSRICSDCAYKEPTNEEIRERHDFENLYLKDAEPPESHKHREILLNRLKEAEDEAKRLWCLLDDVSTAGDMFKPDIDDYFIYVNRKAEDRNGKITSDGYKLYWNEDK